MILILGGARAGKSAAAVRMAAGSGRPVTYVATAEAGDDEMAERIKRHRAQRPASWSTVFGKINWFGRRTLSTTTGSSATMGRVIEQPARGERNSEFQSEP